MMAKYSAAQRRKHATWKSKGRKGKNGKAHFPIGDKKHARFAMSQIRHAPSSKRKSIARRAKKYIGCTKSIARYLGCEVKKK